MNDNAMTTLYHLKAAEEPLTTTELAKLVFDPDDTDDVRNADRKVRHYLDTYGHLAESVEREDGTTVYTADDDRLHFGVGKVDVVTSPDEEVTVGLGSVMVYVDEEDEPHVASVEFEVEEADGSVETGSAAS